MLTPERQLVAFGPGDGLPPVSVRAAVRLRSGSLEFRLVVAGVGYLVPGEAACGPERRDGLWRQTCAELFVGVVGRCGYLEWNLSPSGHWNLYRFEGYRADGRPETAISDGSPRVDRSEQELIIIAALPLAPLGLADLPLEVGVSAVMESATGDLSHWAWHHPAARPDFHDRRGFVLRLDSPADAGKDRP